MLWASVLHPSSPATPAQQLLLLVDDKTFAGWNQAESEDEKVQESARLRTQGNSVGIRIMSDKRSSPSPAWLLTSKRPQDFFGGKLVCPKDFRSLP